MAEIDRLRGEASSAIEMRRLTCSTDDDVLVVARRPSRRTTVREAEARVEAALREWWAQGCREGSLDALLYAAQLWATGDSLGEQRLREALRDLGLEHRSTP